MATYYLSICSEHARFKENEAKLFSGLLNCPGGNLLRLSLPTANATSEGQVGNCLFLTLMGEKII